MVSKRSCEDCHCGEQAYECEDLLRRLARHEDNAATPPSPVPSRIIVAGSGAVVHSTVSVLDLSSIGGGGAGGPLSSIVAVIRAGEGTPEPLMGPTIMQSVVHFRVNLNEKLHLPLASSFTTNFVSSTIGTSELSERTLNTSSFPAPAFLPVTVRVYVADDPFRISSMPDNSVLDIQKTPGVGGLLHGTAGSA